MRDGAYQNRVAHLTKLHAESQHVSRVLVCDWSLGDSPT
jgi:hypothetical protein